MLDKHKTQEMCLTAVEEYGRTLKYVPDEMKTLELCLIAVKNDHTALKYVPEALKKDCMRLVQFWDVDNSRSEKYVQIYWK